MFIPTDRLSTDIERRNATMSLSEIWRDKGRDFHKKAVFLQEKWRERTYSDGPVNNRGHQNKVASIPENEPSMRFPQQEKELLQQAVMCYEKAIKVAGSHSELASAHKNCAVALRGLCALEDNADDKRRMEEYIKILKHLSCSLNFGLLSSFSDQWLNRLQNEYVSCFSGSLEICSQFNCKSRIKWLAKIKRVIVDECFKFRSLTEICGTYLTTIVPLIEKKVYGRALAYTQDCSIFLKEADQVAVTSNDRKVLDELKRSNNALNIQASAMVKILKGESSWILF